MSVHRTNRFQRFLHRHLTPSSGKSFFRRAEPHFGRKNYLRPEGFYIFVSANEKNPIPEKPTKIQIQKQVKIQHPEERLSPES